MDSKKRTAPPSSRDYDDFEPETELAQEEDCDTFVVSVPGFKKTELKLQLSKDGTLCLSGERPLGGNKWSRMQKEFPIQTNCDTNKINAQLKQGILYIRLPKLIAPAPEKTDEQKPVGEANQMGQKSTDKPQPPNETTTTTTVAKGISEKEKTEGDNVNAVAKDEKRTKEKEKTEADNVNDVVKDEKVSKEEEKTEADNVNTAAKNEKRASEKHENGGDLVGSTSRATATMVATKKMGMLVNMLLIILLAIVLGLYATNWIQSSKKNEN